MSKLSTFKKMPSPFKALPMTFIRTTLHAVLLLGGL